MSNLRDLVQGEKVRVYYNLHKKKFSVKSGKHVVAYLGTIDLIDVKFIVNEKGRQRVLKSGQKNVHAFVEGFYNIDNNNGTINGSIFYNPYTTSNFLYDNTAIHQAKKVRLKNKRVYLVEAI
jgi:hypothetical protein